MNVIFSQPATSKEGPAILARLMQRHPLTDIASRS
ncbi:hypothetical protein FHX14_002879 [Rhizobium sp. BK619]|nr:hypothetical protein [Rhizobium sp. BK619]